MSFWIYKGEQHTLVAHYGTNLLFLFLNICINNREENRKLIETFKLRFKKIYNGGAVVENLPTNAGDTGSSPGLGRSHMPRSN